MNRSAYYVSLIREAALPLEITPPELPPSLEALVYPGAAGPLGGIRAVLLDVYGTLFASAAGDIGLAGAAVRGEPLEALARECGLDGEGLRAYFTQAVLEAQGRLSPRTPYPEVRVEELWAPFPGLPRERGEWALRYELAVNPVFPMPALGETLAALREGGFPLGLISNAQFFTPLLFEAFLGGPPPALGFDPRLLIYSFEEGAAKPSPRLFAKAASVLDSQGIPPQAVLYGGNDMLNDILPAASAGFKTVLFAGDRRSLRLREGHPVVGPLRPSRVIRSLPALLGLVAGGSGPPAGADGPPQGGRGH